MGSMGQRRTNTTRDRAQMALRRRIASSPRVARIMRGLVAEQVSGGQFDQPPADYQATEFAALRSFMQRAFQVLAYNGIEGDYAEFGCCGARTFTLAWGAAQLTGHDAHFWAFDSFVGLPPSSDPRDDHAGWGAGAMAMSEADFVATCTARGIPADRFTTVPGFYDTSLRRTDVRLPDRIAFVYIDCDLYSSTVEVLTFLEPRLRHGMVIASDDYYCYSETHASGERMALGQLFETNERWRLVPFVQWGWAGMSFIVEDRATGPSGHAHW